MSCYFRHLKDIFEEAGVEVTKENKKEIDRVIHDLAWKFRLIYCFTFYIRRSYPSVSLSRLVL